MQANPSVLRGCLLALPVPLEQTLNSALIAPYKRLHSALTAPYKHLQRAVCVCSPIRGCLEGVYATSALKSALKSTLKAPYAYAYAYAARSGGV
jgi:hypothetical protein